MKKNVQLVVGEFPSFGDSQTRAIGTPDEGKTSWAVGDELLITSRQNNALHRSREYLYSLLFFC